MHEIDAEVQSLRTETEKFVKYRLSVGRRTEDLSLRLMETENHSLHTKGTQINKY